MKQFKPGDAVMLPKHGLAQVLGVEAREKKQFYKLQTVQQDMTVYVSVTQADEVGIRKPISKKEVEELLKNIGVECRVKKAQTSWFSHFREISEAIKSGNAQSISQAYSELYAKRENMSFGEHQMYKEAHRLLTEEIAASLNIELHKAEYLLLEKINEKQT